jgi:hypothetical protein
MCEKQHEESGAIAGFRATGPPAYIAGALPTELQRLWFACVAEPLT